MNAGKLITSLAETTTVPAESSYLVHMGDGTGSRHVKHKNLVNQLKEEVLEGMEPGADVQEMTYDETMAVLNADDEESEAV